MQKSWSLKISLFHCFTFGLLISQIVLEAFFYNFVAQFVFLKIFPKTCFALTSVKNLSAFLLLRLWSVGSLFKIVFGNKILRNKKCKTFSKILAWSLDLYICFRENCFFIFLCWQPLLWVRQGFSKCMNECFFFM